MTMNNKWDESYNMKEYRYGEAPNLFFKQVIDKLPTEKFFFRLMGRDEMVYMQQQGDGV